jgi:hypothetical protein
MGSGDRIESGHGHRILGLVRALESALQRRASFRGLICIKWPRPIGGTLPEHG